MVSKIILYKTNITPERNANVDDIAYYLSQCPQQTFDDCMFAKHDLSISVKLPINQSVVDLGYNYCSIQNGTDKVFYYFIKPYSWKSEGVKAVELAMDTINTFQNDYKNIWKDHTNITRQHKDRFERPVGTPTYNTIFRRIDMFEEGLNPTKFKKGEPVKQQQDNNDLDWYLIYKNKQGITADTKVPIDCYCCASQELQITPTQTGLIWSEFADKDLMVILAYENENFTYEGTTIGVNQTYKALVIQRYGNALQLRAVSGDGTAYRSFSDTTSRILSNYALKVHLDENRTTYGLNDIGNYQAAIVQAVLNTDRIIISSYNRIVPFSSVDRSDTRIVKIIKLPYAPFTPNYTGTTFNIPNGWNCTEGLLKLIDLNSEFESYIKELGFNNIYKLNLTQTEFNNIHDLPHDMKFESKLFNSNFYSNKFIYDSFEKEILPERGKIDMTQYSPPLNQFALFRINFKPSNGLTSNSVFKIKPPEDNSLFNYNEPVIYGEYLQSTRNNEVGLYNSEYLNYLRTGYNYDLKANTVRNVGNYLGVGLGAIGSIASFSTRKDVGIASGISFATSAISNLTGAIVNTIQQENSMKQKLDQLQHQASSVSNTNDLDLLSYYNGNRLLLSTEEVSDNVKHGIYNLFRLTGYACNDYGIPNVNSRYWYNFVQCSPEFDEKQFTYGSQYLEDIKARFGVGVTYYHHTANTNNYDWFQDKENIEAWL